MKSETASKGSALAKYQVLPPLSDEEYRQLKDHIKQNGVQVPVLYDENGNILDGHHRVRICIELGLEEWPRQVRRGLSEEAKKSLAIALNINRRHLTRQQREKLWAEMKAAGMTNVSIAKADGTVSKDTVLRALRNSVCANDQTQQQSESVNKNTLRSEISELIEALSSNHLTRDQRIPIWAKMKAAGMSCPAIAKTDGTVRYNSVRDTLLRLAKKNAQPVTQEKEQSTQKVVGIDGKNYPSTKQHKQKPSRGGAASKTETAPEKKQRIVRDPMRASEATWFAEMAIAQIDSIDKDDPKAIEALRMVREYVDGLMAKWQVVSGDSNQAQGV